MSLWLMYYKCCIEVEIAITFLVSLIFLAIHLWSIVLLEIAEYFQNRTNTNFNKLGINSQRITIISHWYILLAHKYYFN